MMTRNPPTSLIDCVPEIIAPGGPEWLVGLRQRAADALRETGFPHKKVEDWRFTPLSPVTNVPFAPADREAATYGESELRERIGDDGTFPIALVNGRPQVTGEPPRGIEVASLAHALERDPDAVGAHLGRYAPETYFAGLNAALFEDGLFIRVRAGAAADVPLHLVHLAMPGAGPVAAYPRIVVAVDSGAELRLVETFLGREGEKHLTNTVAEVAVGEGAAVDHVRVVHGVPTGYHVANLSVYQDRDSSYSSRVVALGGGLTRLDVGVKLDGEGASCVLDGVYHVGGKDHVDHHTVIDHVRPQCTSQEVYRGLLDERGHAVFDGTVFVRRDAQHSSAHQENRNLLLSDDATINTKPHLEIDADDVSCSHGATIGALDESELFYLRSRGIGEAQAQAILTYSFVREVLDRIPLERIRHRLGEALLDRLPHGDTIREIL